MHRGTFSSTISLNKNHIKLHFISEYSNVTNKSTQMHCRPPNHREEQTQKICILKLQQSVIRAPLQLDKELLNIFYLNLSNKERQTPITQFPTL